MIQTPQELANRKTELDTAYDQLKADLLESMQADPFAFLPGAPSTPEAPRVGRPRKAATAPVQPPTPPAPVAPAAPVTPAVVPAAPVAAPDPTSTGNPPEAKAGTTSTAEEW